MTTSEEELMNKAKDTLKNAIGKLTVTKGFFNDMKTDLYNEFVVHEKLGAKL